MVKPKFVFDPAKVEHLIINKQTDLEKIGKDPNVKWFGLEHKGVNFYQRYEPHGRPLLYKVSCPLIWQSSNFCPYAHRENRSR